ncbi:MAG: sarcosine oxidase subunit gamma [Phyllobacteriaceae bacterium]|nr:sarcosine oxidase subunit gamma [Phyllobacteriaceae bacterium]
MLEARYESPLASRSASTDTSVTIREISERGMIDLRGAATDKKFMAAAKATLGVDLPKAPRTSTTWGDIKVLWLSPDQWLVTCPRAKAQELADQLSKDLAGIHSLAVNVSDMRAIIRLEGEGVREVLMKGSTLDLTDGDYTPGTVRRMRFAEIAALLSIVEDNVIDVYVFRSYADYTWNFLVKAARKGSEVKLFPNAG